MPDAECRGWPRIGHDCCSGSYLFPVVLNEPCDHLPSFHCCARYACVRVYVRLGRLDSRVCDIGGEVVAWPWRSLSRVVHGTETGVGLVGVTVEVEVVHSLAYCATAGWAHMSVTPMRRIRFVLRLEGFLKAENE